MLPFLCCVSALREIPIQTLMKHPNLIEVYGIVELEDKKENVCEHAAI
jgi:hypothetical protein